MTAKIATVPTPDPEIVEILTKLDVENRKQLVSNINLIIAKLIQQKWAYKVRLNPKRVGLHPCNRWGSGVDGAEVHALGSDIKRLGFSEAECDPTAWEDSDDKSIAKFTIGLQAKSEFLGTSEPDEIIVGSTSCGHTNQFGVAAICGVPSVYDNVTIDGRLSVSKIGEDDVGYQKFLDEGLLRLVFRREVAVMYPTLPKLVAAAKNAGRMLQREDSVFQMLLDIATQAGESDITESRIVSTDVRIVNTRGNCRNHGGRQRSFPS